LLRYAGGAARCACAQVKGSSVCCLPFHHICPSVRLVERRWAGGRRDRRQEAVRQEGRRAEEEKRGERVGEGGMVGEAGGVVSRGVEGRLREGER